VPRLGGLLYDVRPDDPATLLAATGLLLGVAGVACWLPGWRAARIAPRRSSRPTESTGARRRSQRGPSVPTIMPNALLAVGRAKNLSQPAD
jgi:hypothetical protein